MGAMLNLRAATVSNPAPRAYYRKSNCMKKTFFSFGVVIASAFYVLFNNNSGNTAVTPPAPVATTGAPLATTAGTSSPAGGGTTGSGTGNGTPNGTNSAQASGGTGASASKTAKSGASRTGSGGTNTAPSGSTGSAAPAPTPTPAPKPQGLYRDGTYTGSQADAYYGIVQVQADIQNGKIANVTFLQYPNTHSTSVYINSQAMPYLTQEAIQIQNANVDIISGATDTSLAFQQSLASALAQAKN